MGTQNITVTPRWFAARLIWRFLSGNFMDGDRHGDSTWTKPARDPNERLSKWVKMPRLKRAFIRNVSFWSVVTLTALAFTNLWAAYLFVGLWTLYLFARVFLAFRRRYFHPIVHSGKVQWIASNRLLHKVEWLPESVTKHLGGKDG